MMNPALRRRRREFHPPARGSTLHGKETITCFGLVRWLPAALALLAVAGCADVISAVFRMCYPPSRPAPIRRDPRASPRVRHHGTSTCSDAVTRCADSAN
jgi:hypothetical protein